MKYTVASYGQSNASYFIQECVYSSRLITVDNREEAFELMTMLLDLLSVDKLR